jgi:hypothetical protein
MLTSKRVFIGSALAVVAVASVAYAAIPQNGVITGCFARSGGALRLIDPTTGNCKSGEQKIEWNQQGPMGPQGTQGAPGQPGTVGPTEGVNSTDIESSPVSNVNTFDFTDQYGGLRSSFSDDGGANYPYADDFQSTFTTTKPGKLFLTLRAWVALGCSGGGLGWTWMKLDGQPVKGSLTRVSAVQDQPQQVLTGVTDAVTQAGTHTLDLGARCSSGSPTSTVRDFYSTGTAIVLGS